MAECEEVLEYTKFNVYKCVSVANKTMVLDLKRRKDNKSCILLVEKISGT